MGCKSFNLKVVTINGEIKEFPEIITFPCNQVIAVGESLVRNYDSNNCIVVKSVFLFRYGVNVFGTTQVKDIAQWNQLVSVLCIPCAQPCQVFFDDCPIMFDDCVVYIFR